MTSPAYKLSIGVSIDAGQAKQGGREAVSSIAAIKTSAQTAATSLQQLVDKQLLVGNGPANSNIRSRAADIAAYGAQLDALKAKFDPLFAAQQKYKAKLDEINQAERVGAVTASEAIDLRIRETNAINAQINNLTRLSAARKAAAEAAVARVTVRPDREADIAAYGKGLDDLRAKYNPLYAVTTTYLKTQADIRQAHAVGAISVDEMTAALSRNRQMTLSTIDAIKGRRTALAGRNDNGFAATNAMFQLQDIGMTAAMGMSPAMIGLQQGSQLAGAFSGMGMKQAAGTMATALTGLVSPVSLVAVGLTTATAAAIQFGIGLTEAGENTKGFDEVLASHEALLKRLEDRYGTLIERAKAYAGESSGLLLAAGRTDIRELAASGRQAQAEMFNTFGVIRDRVRGGGDFQVAAEFAPFQDAFRTLREQVKAGKPDFDQFYTSVTKVGSQSTAYGLLADKIIVATQNTKRLNDLLKQQEDRLRAIGNAASRDYGTLARAFEGDNRLRQLNLSRDFTSAMADLDARSPEQLAAAARQREANRFDIGESSDTRTLRIEQAGKIALAQAEKQLRDAQEQRLRSLDASLSSQQLELSLIGKTVGETERLRMEYQLTSQLKDEAARTGTEVDQAELDLIRQKSAAYGRLAETIAGTNLVRDQARSLEALRAELSLVTAADDVRRRSLAVLEAEQQLRERGISATSSAAEQYRQQALAISELNAQINKQADAWNKVKSGGEEAIDGVLDALKDGNAGDALKKFAESVEDTLFDIGVKSPLKNALLGTEHGTLDDLGGLKGLAQKLMGGGASAVGAMSVQAGTVIVNGGVGSAGSLFGTGAANDNSNILPFPKAAGSALSFVGNYKSGVDPRLTDILNTAAQQFPGFKVDAMSGYRAGDTRFHGRGLATDIQLTDLVSGKLLGNYQDASSFSTYERFAQTARSVQMAKYPELADRFRWGGYFGGGKGKYGALDTMHFDLGGAGMAGGSWGSGLNDAQKSLWPGIESKGNAAVAALNKLAGQTDVAASGLGTLGTGMDKFGSLLSSAQGGGGGGGGFLSSLIGLFSPQYGIASSGGIGLYAKGGISDRPAIFGEAGTEAAVPLPDGRTIPVTLHTRQAYRQQGADTSPAVPARNAPIINNYGNNNVEYEETTDEHGNRQPVITIGEHMAAAVNQRGNPMRSAMQQNYGLRPMRIQR